MIAPRAHAAAARLPALVLVPGGRFQMGSPDGRGDEQPLHSVLVSPFYLATTAVTRGAWAAFVAAGHVPAPPWWDDPDFRDDLQPVVGVTWDEAMAYAGWLGEQFGGRWRLPTEAEWEWAARGGLTRKATPWGDELPEGEVPTGPLRGPWRVGLGSPNGYGLMDMGTIVHEWCLDWYRPGYPEGPLENPIGPRSGERRTSRGGSWRHHVRFSPPWARSSLPPHLRYADYGFRVLRELDA